MSKIKTYNLEWHVGVSKKETLLTNSNFGLCLHVKDKATKQKSYTMGRLLIKPCN
jgi:hypothetical protein